LPVSLPGIVPCGNCLVKPPPFETTFSPLLFHFPVNRLVHKFKFQRDLATGRLLGELFSGKVREQRLPLPDILVAVPMHRFRLIQRGLNPAFELARQVSRCLGIHLAVHDLQRIRGTPTQTGLDAVQRKRNLKGAFHWRGGRLDGQSVALVDDVMTTGSTMKECANVLKKSGATCISAWTLARAVIR